MKNELLLSVLVTYSKTHTVSVEEQLYCLLSRVASSLYV